MKVLLAIISLATIPQSVLAMNYGQALVNKAYSVAGSPYVSGYPPNEWSCPGGHFDFSSWVPSNGVDCSGLVSYAADLRRRYLTGDLSGATFSNPVNWDSLQAGDLLHSNGGSDDFPVAHVMIFVSRNGDNLTVIHAGSPGVVERTWNISLIRDTWFFAPYRLKYDTTPANTAITGVEDGRIYNNDVTADFTVTDAIDSYPCGKFYVNDVLTLHDKNGSKTFSQEGTYQLLIHSEDWARNTQDTSVGFAIDKTSPLISTTSASTSRVDPVTNNFLANIEVSISDKGTGLKSVEFFKKPLGQPLTMETVSVTEGQSDLTHIFADLPDGFYQVKARDGSNNESSLYFELSTTHENPPYRANSSTFQGITSYGGGLRLATRDNTYRVPTRMWATMEGSFVDEYQLTVGQGSAVSFPVEQNGAVIPGGLVLDDVPLFGGSLDKVSSLILCNPDLPIPLPEDIHLSPLDLPNCEGYSSSLVRTSAGVAEFALRTSDRPDFADASFFPVGRITYFYEPGPYPVFFAGGTYEKTILANYPQNLKRYTQGKITFQSNPGGFNILGQYTYNYFPGGDMTPTSGYTLFNAMVRTQRISLSATPQFPNTPTGDNIALVLNDGLSVSYQHVDTEGQTRVDFLSGSLPVPTSYKSYPGSPVFDLMTTAGVRGPITVTLNYSDAGLTLSQEQALKLLHRRSDGVMEDVTASLDTVNNRLVGTLASLSPFTVAIQDAIPPATITNLAARVLDGTSVKLSWIAPGNDQMSGQAQSYDIRYATFPISEAAFSLAPGVLSGDSLRPAVAGARQTLDVGSLKPTTTYFFAIRAVDDAGNLSAVSNITTAITTGFTLTKTQLAFSTPRWQSDGGGVYLGTATAVSFSASTSTAELGATYFGVDLSTDIMATGLSDATTGVFSVYSASFALTEGEHVIGFGSVDSAGNYELLKTKRVFVDGAPPEMQLSVGGVVLTPGTTAYIATGNSISLSAIDLVSNGVVSGMKSMNYVVDVAGPCQSNPGFTGPAGTCENPAYEGSFALSAGTHTIRYKAFDNVGNQSQVKIISLVVIPDPDITPPVTRLYINGVMASSGTLEYVQAGSSIALVAGDPLVDNAEQSGVASRMLAVAKYQSNNWVIISSGIYTGPIVVNNDGYYTFYYRSSDNAGNLEAQKYRIRRVDGTPPVTEFQVSGSSWTNAQGRLVVSVDHYISLISTDPLSGGVASGIKGVSYTVDLTSDSCHGEPTFTGPAGTCENPSYTGPFTLSVGTHAIHFQAFDNADNLEPVKTVRLTVAAPDRIPPDTMLFINGVEASSGAVVYVQSGSSLTLSAEDPLVEDAVRSGVAFSTFTITKLVSENWVTVGSGTYSGPIVVNGEGPYTFYYNSVDNAGNWEHQNHRIRRVDGTPPITELQILGSNMTDTQGDLVISTDHYISLISSDPVVNGVASGLKQVLYSLDDGPFAVLQGTFTLTEGFHRVAYYSVDNVDNAETISAKVILIDAASPGTTASVTGIVGANGWHVSPVVLTLVSTDDMSGVASVFYGLERVVSESERELLSSGAYAEPLTVNDEGIYAYSYYSTDLVGNIAIESTGSFKIDRTLPISTASLAGTFSGGHYSGAVTVTIMSTDALSGVATSFYSLDGAEFAEYLLPVQVIADGHHTVRHYALDLAGNPELEQITEFDIAPAGPAIEAPVSVYFDEVGADRIVASAYAPGFTNLTGDAGTRIAKDGEYADWHVNGSTWTERTPISNPGSAVASVGGKIYMLGGGGNPLIGYSAQTEEYDPVSDAWTAKTDMLTTRVGLAAAVVSNKVYASGGSIVSTSGVVSTNINEEYDPESNTWAVKAPMPTVRFGLSAVSAGGKIYALGGQAGGIIGTFATNEEYDPVTNTWQGKAPMPEGRVHLSASSLYGKVYVLGGLCMGGSCETRNDEYAPATDTWAIKAAMPTGRGGLASAVVGGKIYAVGGFSGSKVASNEEYDPVIDTWTIRPGMPTAKDVMKGAAAGGKIYIVGGSLGMVDGNMTFHAENQEYDPGVSTVFTGLTPNTQYSFKAMARDAALVETAESTSTSVYTLAATPLAGTAAYTILSSSEIALNWQSNGNPAGTLYQAELSTSAAFTTAQVSDTTDMTTTFSGLLPDTTYYARVKARNNDGVWTNPRSIAEIYMVPAASGPVMESPVSVYFDEIGADRIVVSAYAPVFTGLTGDAGIRIA